MVTYSSVCTKTTDGNTLLKIDAPKRGVITRIVIKQTVGAANFSYAVYDRDITDLTDPEVHLIIDTIAVTGTTDKQLTLSRPYANSDVVGSSSPNIGGFYILITASGERTYQIGTTVQAASLT